MSKIFLEKENDVNVILSKDFIFNHMPYADGEFVKVYIYLKYLMQLPQTLFDIDRVARDLNLLESDVLKAIQFWNERKILKLEKDNEENIIISFNQENVKSEHKSPYIPPVYSTEDISHFYETDEKFKFLIDFAQKSYCKTFNKFDVDILLEIYDWLKLPVEVICILIKYLTVTKNNRNMKYLEQIAISWKELNIDTVEKAEEYINSQEDKTKIKRLVLQNLGVYNRAPTKIEDEIMNTWINDWKFSPDVILYACNFTKNVNNPTVNYVNGILKKWYEQGLKDIESIQQHEQEQKKDKDRKKQKTKAEPEQRDASTYAQLEELFKKVVRNK